MSSSDALRTARVAVSNASVLRCRSRLAPAGGPSDKVFPATYEGGRYAMERRRIEGREVDCVVLDSVQSQANRMEHGLLKAWRGGWLSLPVIAVEFASVGLPDIATVTSLDAPHRIFDAILRDSMLAGVPFPESEIGRAVEGCSVSSASAMFEHCPTVLLFGGWNSTGRRGGLGVKIPRAIVSEVIGVDVIVGVRTKSRLDPLQIGASVEVFVADDSIGWTTDSSQAVSEKGRPRLVPARNPGDRAGRPSVLNHSSVLPSLEDGRGGVSLSYAEQTTVVSMAGLRRLGFPIKGQRSEEVDAAARTVLALLGLIAVEILRGENQQLRSRCVLVPDQPPQWEVLDSSGAPPRSVQFEMDGLLEGYKQALKAARRVGLPWRDELVTLTPSAQLVSLVKESRRRSEQRGRFSVDEEPP